MKIFTPIAILLMSLIGAVIIVVSKPDVKTSPAEAPRPLIRVLNVQKHNITMKVKSQGSVTPRTESTLVSQVAGRVVAVSPAFAAGGFFEKGDVLVSVDKRDYELALTQAKAQVAQAEMRLKWEKQEAEVAKKEWQRLGNDGSAPDLVLRKPQLAEAEAGYAASQAAMQLADLNLGRTQIRAPYAGRVRTKLVDVGQYLNPGVPVAQIYAVDWAEVRLPLPDNDLAFLDIPLSFRGNNSDHVGPEVILRGNFAGRVHEWRGFIARLEGEIDARSRMVYAVARVENPYGKSSDNRPPLAIGMFVDAEIIGVSIDDLIAIPRSALRDNSQVLIVDQDNRLRFRNVEIFRIDTDTVIIESGLENGETLCISPLETVVDGMHVRIYEGENQKAQAANWEATQ
ncbi:MAG: efflux RND transporter periplasmic adaptor subunit [bacterium]